MTKKKRSNFSNHLGFYGERMAGEYLLMCGYMILARNYRGNRGEIDIIAKENEDIVFVEVKTRKGMRFGKGEESIDYRKLRKIYGTSLHYLSLNGKARYRFEAVILYLDNELYPKKIRHIRNIFL